MKLSALSIEELKTYCRAEDEEDSVFEIILDACKAFIRGQTGLTDDEMDKYEDLTMAAMILASDMYDNRAYQQKQAKVTANMAVKAIIDQYQMTIL